ncbi:MAG: glycosyltransferase family 4 protein [Solirubrobacterales bacterium]|nr:glycosyltransferase family 4 protein [Solirubrobacterales bacterium]
MRLTYVSRRAWPARGGIERYLYLFATELAVNHDVQVLSQQVADAEIGHLRVAMLGADFKPFTRNGLHTEPLRLTVPEKIRLLPLAARSLAYRVPRLGLVEDNYRRYGAVIGDAMARTADRPDVLHLMNGGNFAAAGAHASRRLGVPLVVTPQAHPGQWDDDPASGEAYRKAQKVIASGEADARTYLGLDVAPQRVAIVPPCSAPLPQGRGEPLRRDRQLDGPLVLFLGVRREYKGVDVLMQAAPQVSRDVPGVTFAFVGPGAALPPAPDGVRILDVGPVDEEEKAGWLEAADVLALPSGYESFGLVVAEAWSLGTPVVTSTAPALVELVKAGGGGLAVPRETGALARALVDVLRDPAAARDMGAKGRAHWRAHHTPERTARRLLEIYSSL